MKRFLQILTIVLFAVVFFISPAFSTVSIETTKSPVYAGTGTTGPFTYPFKIWASTDLEVIKTTATGVSATLVLNVDYTVTGIGVSTGGTVTLTTALAVGESLIIVRNMPYLQQQNFVSGSTITASALNNSLDKLEMQIQQLREIASRSLQLDIKTALSTPHLSPVANNLIGWDSVGTGLTNYDVVSTLSVPTLDYIGNYGGNLSTAISTIGSTPKFLQISEGVTLTESLTIPSNLELWIPKGGAITLGSYDLLINGPFHGSPGCFIQNGTGRITFGPGAVAGINPLWWNNNAAPNTTDMAEAFQSAITAAQSSANKIKITKGIYYLGSQLVSTSPHDIDCDDATIMRWGTSSAGWKFDWAAPANCRINLPIFMGPGVNSSFAIPGYPGSQNEATLSGVGVHIRNNYGMFLNIQHMVGFATQLKFESDGAFVGNHVVNFKVMDFSIEGIQFLTTATAGSAMDGIQIKGNTIFSRRIITLDASAGGYITGLNVDIETPFSESTGTPITGGGVYGAGTAIYSNQFRFGRFYAGYSAYDSPLGTSNTLKLPYVWGDQTSKGETGFFGGKHNTFLIGNTTMLPDGSVPLGGGPPVAGDPYRIKVRGYGSPPAGNRVVINPDRFTSGAVVLSSTQGEANFNGGVGSAEITRYVPCSITVTSLAAGAHVDFYLYHQCITYGLSRPIKIISGDPNLIGAWDNGANVNREIIVEFVNKTASAITGTYTFWVEVD